MASRLCDGTTAAGSKCRRRVRDHERYCPLHNVSPSIALSSYVSVTPEDRFWTFYPDEQKWSVGSEYGTKLFSPGSGSSYVLKGYASAGTYGAVYFGTRVYDDKEVAVKLFKEVFRKGSRRDPVDYDFMKEYYMHRAVIDRVPRGSVVRMLDAFFVRTANGLHGAIVMEKMDGSLFDLFEERLRPGRSRLQLEAFRLWVFACRSIAKALLDLHAHKIYHLDIKPGNVLYAKIPEEPGVVMKLVDLGFACYIGGTPIVPCYATGSYVPPEWRADGDKNDPTFDLVVNQKELEMGEMYAMCVTFAKMLRNIRIGGALKRSEKLGKLLDAIRLGREEGRHALTTRAFVNLTSDLLDELNAAMQPQMAGAASLLK